MCDAKKNIGNESEHKDFQIIIRYSCYLDLKDDDLNIINISHVMLGKFSILGSYDLPIVFPNSHFPITK